MSRRRDLAPRARRALLWGLAGFVAIQLAIDVAMDSLRPALRDPEFGFKLDFLKQRLRQVPDQPLLLVLGSSRTGLGFRPDVLRVRGLTAFNFSLTGIGPIGELTCLESLLRQGIKPDAILVEVFPLWLHQEGEHTEESQRDIRRFGSLDLEIMRRYSEDPRELTVRWLLSRLTPAFSHRYSIMSWFAPDWLPDGSRQDGWAAMDANGWLAYSRPEGNEAERRRATAQACEEYDRALTGFHVTPSADRALRDLLALCRREGIDATLLVMPEGSEFQSWYGCVAQAEIDCYLSRVGRECGVSVIDARDWMEDSAFFDGHHLYPSGSAAFTRRLARESLPTLLKRKGRVAERSPRDPRRDAP